MARPERLPATFPFPYGDEHEHVSFVYQRIELTDLDSNTVALDDWTSFQ
jgi:hypothetical protein